MGKRTWSQAKIELGPPKHWLHCPNKGKIVSACFLPFKTPLSHRYDRMVPEKNRFYASMALKGSGQGEKEIGLWIDLTNTTRYYDKEDVKKAGVEYVKLTCKGFGECPSEKQVQVFVNACKSFSERSGKIIGVHCTHGFNRTGFLIASYLVIEKEYSIDVAVAAFASARPPGIYRQEYILELYRRFGKVALAPAAPKLPKWCSDEPDEQKDDLEAPSAKRRNVAEDSKLDRGIPSEERAEGQRD